MKPLPILLTARRGNWQRYKSRERNQRFLEIKKKILTRDHYTCRYCLFTSKKYNTVVNHDNDYSHNNAKNMVTACPFCAQCFFLDGIGSDNNTGGIIVHLPEVSQADLNHFCRVLFSSMLRDAPYKGKLQATYLSLSDRAKPVEELFGPDSSNPVTFGQSLIDSNLSKQQLEGNVLKDLRLLPERQYFKEEILYWKKTIFDQIPL